jgi:hypothetical protein
MRIAMIKTTLLSFALFTAAFAAVACTNSSDPIAESSVDELRASSACQNKTCGEPCSVCAGRPDCIETAVLKFCNADGQCRPEQPFCAAACPTLSPPAPSFCPNGTIKPREQSGCVVGYDCVPRYEPCAGKVCGASCNVCPPGDPDCIETAEVKVCQIDGTCSGVAPACD